MTLPHQISSKRGINHFLVILLIMQCYMLSVDIFIRIVLILVKKYTKEVIFFPGNFNEPIVGETKQI